MRGITEVLGALDDKIDLNRRMNETLEALARALFKSWFVDFDGDGAGSSGRSWQPVPVAEVAELNSWTLGAGDSLPSIRYIEISEVLRGDIGNVTAYTRGDEPSRARRRLRHGDTVISTVRPDRGAYFLCLSPAHDLIASTGFAVITPQKVPWSFLHCALTQPDVFATLGRLADGGAYPAIRPDVIGDLPVTLPADDAPLARFHQIAEPLLLKADCNRRESRTLAELRDTLLPKLLSGELRVRDAEKTVAAAV
jgi:type I restriction enzyme S subunit